MAAFAILLTVPSFVYARVSAISKFQAQCYSRIVNQTLSTLFRMASRSIVIVQENLLVQLFLQYSAWHSYR